jgi:hypothetical protein
LAGTSRHAETRAYLNRPILPLAVALPQMLAQIEAELATPTGPAEEQWLRHRAELIRGLLSRLGDIPLAVGAAAGSHPSQGAKRLALCRLSDARSDTSMMEYG